MADAFTAWTLVDETSELMVAPVARQFARAIDSGGFFEPTDEGGKSGQADQKVDQFPAGSFGSPGMGHGRGVRSGENGGKQPPTPQSDQCHLWSVIEQNSRQL